MATGVSLAVGHFNDGATSTCKTLKFLGIKAGYHTTAWSLEEDKLRIKQSEKKASETKEKKIRQVLRQQRKQNEEEIVEKEGITYLSGGF